MTSSTIAQLSNGNMGAATFLITLVKSGAPKEILDKIETSGITGTDLWVLYSDICGKNLERSIQLIDNCPLPLLKDACSRQDYSGQKLVLDYLK